MVDPVHLSECRFAPESLRVLLVFLQQSDRVTTFSERFNLCPDELLADLTNETVEMIHVKRGRYGFRRILGRSPAFITLDIWGAPAV